jgi:hypothetical protein
VTPSPEQDPRGEQSSPAARHHRLVVDRIEGELAVVETGEGQFLDLPRWLLPAGAREGDVVTVQSRMDEDGARRLELRVDSAATETARSEVVQILERLRSRDPGGDIEL